MNRLGSLSSLSAVAETPPSARAVSRRDPPCVLLSTPCGTILEEQSTTTNFAWSRRHSLHSQPQPLSVQGFGYGYNRPKQDLLNLKRRMASNMVAGRRVEEGRSTAAIMEQHRRKTASPALMAYQQRKMASPAFVEAVLNNQHRYYHRSPMAQHATAYQHLVLDFCPTNLFIKNEAWMHEWFLNNSILTISLSYELFPVLLPSIFGKFLTTLSHF